MSTVTITCIVLALLFAVLGLIDHFQTGPTERSRNPVFWAVMILAVCEFRHLLA